MTKSQDLNILLRIVDRVSGPLTKIRRTFRTFSTQILTGVAVIGKGFQAVTAAIAGMVAAFKLGQFGIDEFAKSARTLGVLVSELQGFELAASEAGISSTALRNSIQRMNRNVADAVSGFGPLRRQLSALGLDARELQAAGPAEAFKIIVDRINEVPDAMTRTQLAFAAFGREGVAIMRLNSEAIDDATRRLEEMGAIATEQQVQMIEAANDSLGFLSRISQGIGRQISAGLAPAVDTLSNFFTEGIADLIDYESAAQKFGRVMVFIVGQIIDVVDLLRVAWNSLLRPIKIAEVASLTLLERLAEAANRIPGINPIPDSVIEKIRSNGQIAREELSDLNQHVRDLWTRDNSDELLAEYDDFLARFNDANANAQTTPLEIDVTRFGAIGQQNQQGTATGDAVDAPDPQVEIYTRNAETRLQAVRDFNELERLEVMKTTNIYQEYANSQIAANAAMRDDAQLHRDEMSSIFSSLGSIFSALPGIVGDSSRKSFKILRLFEIGVSTAAAISAAVSASAWSARFSGPVGALTAYASVIGPLLSAVGQIRSLSLGSTATTSAVSGGGTNTPNLNADFQGSLADIPSAPQRTINLTLSGTGTYSADDVQSIIEAINDNDTGTQINSERVAA